MQILRFINQCGEPPGVSQIAHTLGINPSTCFNILKTLVHERLLVFDPVSKRYSLGLGIVELAHGVLNAGYMPYIHPYLERISTTFGVTALLWQDAGQNRFVLVDKSESNRAIRVQITIGQRFPALIGAFGRCVAAQRGLARDELRKMFAGLRWQNPPSFEDYLKQVEEARQNGYSIDQRQLQHRRNDCGGSHHRPSRCAGHGYLNHSDLKPTAGDRHGDAGTRSEIRCARDQCRHERRASRRAKKLTAAFPAGCRRGRC